MGATPPAEKRTNLGPETRITLGVFGAVVVGAISASIWINTGLQKVDFRMQMLDERTQRIERILEKTEQNAITRAEMKLWIQLNNAEGNKLSKFPSRT